MLGQMPQDQYISVGGTRTRFWALGDKGSPVVLIHGIGLSVESWAANIHALAQAHRVFALDLVGFGRSDKPQVPYTLAYFAQFVSDFMAAQDVDRASWIGLSLGGGVALQAAIQFPSKVDKLVLVDAVGLGRKMSLLLRLVTLPWVGEWMSRPSREGSAQFLQAAVHDPSVITDEWIERDYGFGLLPDSQRAFLATLRTSANVLGVRRKVIRSITGKLASITAPTLIVWGKEDRFLPAAQAGVAAEVIPGAQLVVYDRCGHLPPVERPDAFNALVLAFLAA
jgi:4,5:9,10-diseco-3-hydroxy-5,9,17-trioxoandrosta-1(10),2-diene-4-oate hydrolase